jgi:hypothetical protein
MRLLWLALGLYETVIMMHSNGLGSHVVTYKWNPKVVCNLQNLDFNKPYAMLLT